MLFVMLLIADYCSGQRTVLMLQKKNKNKNAYYKAGDEIAFRTNDSNEKIKGRIVNFQDSTVVFDGFEVRLADILSVYIDHKTKWWLRYKIEQLCFIAGGGYLLLYLINGGEPDKETLIISGSLIGAGLAARVLIGHRIKIGGRTKLRILRL